MLHHLGLTMAYRRISSTYLPGFLWCASCHCAAVHSVEQLTVMRIRAFSRIFHFRALDRHAGGVCRTSRIFAKRQAYPARRAVGLAERELEHHPHLNDLLPSPAHASTHA